MPNKKEQIKAMFNLSKLPITDKELNTIFNEIELESETTSDNISIIEQMLSTPEFKERFKNILTINNSGIDSLLEQIKKKAKEKDNG